MPDATNPASSDSVSSDSKRRKLEPFEQDELDLALAQQGRMEMSAPIESVEEESEEESSGPSEGGGPEVTVPASILHGSPTPELAPPTPEPEPTVPLPQPVVSGSPASPDSVQPAAAQQPPAPQAAQDSTGPSNPPAPGSIVQAGSTVSAPAVRPAVAQHLRPMPAVETPMVQPPQPAAAAAPRIVVGPTASAPQESVNPAPAPKSVAEMDAAKQLLADGAAVISGQASAGRPPRDVAVVTPQVNPDPNPIPTPNGPIVGSQPTKAAPLAPASLPVAPDLSAVAPQTEPEKPRHDPIKHPQMFSQNTKAVWHSQRSTKSSVLISLVAVGLLFFAVFAYWMSIGSPTKLEDIPIVRTWSGS